MLIGNNRKSRLCPDCIASRRQGCGKWRRSHLPKLKPQENLCGTFQLSSLSKAAPFYAMRFYTVLPLVAFARAAVIPWRRQDAANQKTVCAHFMVGNTFPYTLQDWTDDITLASNSGLDAFALNVGPDDFQTTQTNNAFQAAQNFGPTFKLFFSLDMSVLPCQTVDDGAALRQRVLNFATHPNQLQFNGKAFVSTFAGESCTFGQGSAAAGWASQFAAHPDLQGKIQFVPSFFIDPATFSSFAGTMDGAFNFNGGWPIQVTTDFANGISTNLTGNAPDGANALNKFIGATDTDTQQIQSLASFAPAGQRLTYMTAVSPHFFTHFGPDSFNKNFIFLADQHLFAQRWENLIGLRDQVDLVEIVTWNDYGESHYVGPIKGALPPGSEVWTNGFPHQAFLDLTKYFATQFKTGQAPTLDKDQIFMWSRPHPTNAQASADSVGAPTNFQLAQDAVWAVVLATADGSVTLSTSPENTQTFPVTAGVNKLSVPIVPGGTLNAQLTRGGQTVVNLATPPTDFTFNGSPTTFNFNIFVASASS
ncbi:glycoside hydrolase [Mycena amicta]|nr:glycoside hydrolase [Mycena amicta]